MTNSLEFTNNIDYNYLYFIFTSYYSNHIIRRAVFFILIVMLVAVLLVYIIIFLEISVTFN